MRQCLFVFAALVWPLVSSAIAEESKRVTGTVVDEAGQPVPGARVDSYWRANGKLPRGANDAGLPPDQWAKFWGSVGEMDTMDGATTNDKGAFSMEYYYGEPHSLMAMDGNRENGGISCYDPDEKQPLVIKLQPLVTVRMKYSCKGGPQRFSWTGTLANAVADRRAGRNSVAFCGSTESNASFKLPPGTYEFQGYGTLEEIDNNIHTEFWKHTVNLKPDEPNVELGVVELTLGKNARLKLEGKWGNLKHYLGKAPPQWHVADALGVNRDVKLADYRNKWVLVYFWNISCQGCVRHGFPTLMKFQKDHAADTDKSAILSFSFDEDISSVTELEKRLAPYAKDFWQGKPLPFPVLIDPTGRTQEKFGILSSPVIMIVDPAGCVAWSGDALSEALDVFKTKAFATTIEPPVPTSAERSEIQN